MKNMTRKDLIFLVIVIAWIAAIMVALFYYRDMRAALVNYPFLILMGVLTFCKVFTRLGAWLEVPLKKLNKNILSQ